MSASWGSHFLCEEISCTKAPSCECRPECFPAQQMQWARWLLDVSGPHGSRLVMMLVVGPDIEFLFCQAVLCGLGLQLQQSRGVCTSSRRHMAL